MYNFPMAAECVVWSVKLDRHIHIEDLCQKDAKPAHLKRLIRASDENEFQLDSENFTEILNVSVLQ